MKVLQKLGKADETKDAAFEEWVINFNKQYAEGSKLQRDLRAYLEAVKAMHESSKNIQSCLADMYEPEWKGHRKVESIVEDCDVLWEDYHQKLVDHALISMDTYLGQFPDIKARIAKRDRKLVDYDSARHTYATTHKTKKKDGGIKLTKPSTLLERATPGWAQGILSAHNVAQSSLSRSQAEEELERAQKVFEEINLDLQEELPSLWNSRVGFYVSTFQSLAAFEEKFHHEMSRLDQDLYDVLVKLENTDTSSGKEASNHTLRPGGPPPIPKSPSKLKPAVPPPPKVTPSKEMKTENIINLFDSANNPDISVTSPTEPANWDSWTDEGAGEEEPPRQHYDPIAAAQEGWGDDGTQPVRYDPIAAAQEGWGDDGTQPVRYDPVAAAQGGWDQEDQQEDHHEDHQDEHYDQEDHQDVHYDQEGNYEQDQEKWDDEGAQPEEETSPLAQDEEPEKASEEPLEEPSVEPPKAEEEAATEATPEPEEAAPRVDVEEAQSDSGAAASSPDAAPDAPAAPEEEQTAAAETAPAAAAAEEEQSTETAPAAEAPDLPPGFLFKVEVMHDYAANDTDELDMKAGDVVLVIPFDNPDEQDDGWLMGMKQPDWEQNRDSAAKGVFPENFTQRL
ncbi:hypothetical protein WMY93_002172 [Mugilogobius chulae]|uniref:Myc box-dependent-interacting protein 1 n=1 Tax=Mugilogobius chulae TaxID=88201 RepID=A0AAW0PT12_9GOBI